MKTDQQTITVYEAIAEMRKLSSLERPFSFSHSTFDQDKQYCHGVRHVQHAILRSAAGSKEIKDARFKLFYKDLDNRENRTCWQPLIMFFNGKKCVLN